MPAADDEQNDDRDDDELAAGFLLRGFLHSSCRRGLFPLAFCLICTVPLICAVWSSCCVLLGLARLLSSEIIFVVGLGDAEGTGQRELGDVVLVERADVLVVRLLGLRLRLRDGQVVGDAGVEALLGLAESFVGEIDVGAGRFDQLGGGLDVEDAVADILLDLLDLVGERGAGLLVLGVGDLLLPAGLGDLQDRRADLTGGRSRCRGSGRAWCRGRRSRR